MVAQDCSGRWLVLAWVLLAAGVCSAASEEATLTLEPRRALSPNWVEWRLAEAGLGDFDTADDGVWEGADELQIAPGSNLFLGPRGVGPTQADAIAQLEHTALSVDGAEVRVDAYPVLAAGKRYFNRDERDVAGSSEAFVAFVGIAAEDLDPGVHAIVLRERFLAPSGPRTLTRHIRLEVAPYQSQAFLKRRAVPTPLPRTDDLFRAPPRSLVITNARLFDGVNETPSDDRAVVIEGNRVRAIHATDAIELPRSARVLDARGATVLPGLIDAHLHTPARDNRRGRWLAEGVTTLVEVSGDSLTALTLRDRWARSHQLRPRILTAGSMILIPDGAVIRRYGTHGAYEVASASAAAAAAEASSRNGVNLIKIALTPDLSGRSLSTEQICGITEAAHRHGIPVMAHVMSQGAVLRAVGCDVDILTHMPRLSDAVVARVRSSGASVVPTLGVYDGDAYAEAASSVRRLLAAGVPIGCGSDFPGGTTLEELSALVDAGLTPAQALQAATRVNAEILGVGASLGTLAPGKIADLIVVEGDPLKDLTALTRIRAVVARGELVRVTARSPGF